MGLTIVILIAGTLVAAPEGIKPATAPSAAAAGTAPAVPVPDDPLGRGTPRSSAENFLAAARDGNFVLAAKYLDLSALAANAQTAQGPRLARQFWFVLERRARTDFSTLSISPLGNLTDGLPPNQEKLERIEWPGGYADVNLERVRDPNGLDVWKVSSRSLERIPKVYERYHLLLGDRIFSEATVDWLVKTQILGLPGVSWLATAVSLCVWVILAFVALRLTHWFMGRMRPGYAHRLVSTIHLPVIVLIATSIVRTLLPERLISGKIAALFHARTAFVVVVVWILFRAVDFAARQARLRLLARDGSAGFSLVDLVRRVVKCSLVLIGLLVWLDNMGFNITTIVASLGVAGIAVGLASQKFIEDLIGAMTLHATAVVRRNEFIKFGEQRGVVEDVGLRMTTIRSLNRTLITLPNATFAAMQVENFGRRDKILYHPRLGLLYETTPDQLRYLLLELRKLIHEHPKVLNEDARVRFMGFGESSLDVEIFCFINERDYAASLAVTEDLNLQIMEIVARAGTAFAFPTTTEYRRDEQGFDEARARRAENEVRRLREQGQLSQHPLTDELFSEPSGTSRNRDPGSTDGW